MEQTAKTKDFIKNVGILIDSGEVKNYTEIINALNWDKTMFSNVIKGRKNIPNDTYRKFKEVYHTAVINEPLAQNDSDMDTESIHTLVHSNQALADANKVLSMTNYELALMLKRPVNDLVKTQPIRELTFLEAYHAFLRAGVKEGRWKSEDEGQLKVDNALRGTSPMKKE